MTREVCPLTDITTLVTQTEYPKNKSNKTWEHYSIPAYDKGKQPVLELGENIKSGKYMVPKNSVLASKLNPQFPRVWLPDVIEQESAICSTEFMPFVPKKNIRISFLYELLRSHPVQAEIMSRITGSTGSRQRVKPKEVAIMPIITPQKAIIDTFSDMVSTIHGKQLANIRECRTLDPLRDALLPKLVSGELRVPAAALELVAQAGVPDADKLIEEVSYD